MTKKKTEKNKHGIEVPTAERIQEELSKAKSMDDFMGKDGILSNLFARTLEQMLETELTANLGYNAHSGENDQGFRRMAITQTGANRSRIPGMPITGRGERRWKGYHTVSRRFLAIGNGLFA